MVAKYGLQQIGWSASSLDEYEAAFYEYNNIMIEFDPETAH